MVTITAVTASILSFLYIKLSLNIVAYRRKYKVSVGDGGHDDLLRAIRTQANLTEYAPVGLMLLMCLEINKAPLWLTVILATVFVVGRLLHPLGMKSKKSPMQPRVIGTVLTFLTLLFAALANIVWVFVS